MTTFYNFTPALALAIRKGLDDQGIDNYRIGFGADTQLLDTVKAAINQGIDAHLEAVVFTQTMENRGPFEEKPVIRIQAESVPTFVRRLAEPLQAHEDTEPDEDGQTMGDRMRALAVDILATLKIEAEFM